MNPTRLVIFARYPTPGRAKTRLIAALGDRGAARLQDRMTRHTLRQAAALARDGGAEVEVRFTGADAPAMAARYGHAWRYVSQGDGGLGERLAAAASHATGHARPVILIGTDCPALGPEVLARAAKALSAGQDLVLGPAVDGGYYLIGLRRFVPQLFAGIDWSTERVLAQTLAVADGLGLSRVMLPVLGDVDLPSDLPACDAALPPEPRPYQPERLAVTGATGCLGRHFLRRVLATLPDTRVTALARAASPSCSAPAFRELADRFGDRLTLIDGDLRDLRPPPAMLRALAESDGGLWHFAACTNLHPASEAAERQTREVNEHGTARLLQFLAGSDRPGPLYHVSTAYVCGTRGGGGVVFEHDSDGGLGFRNPYERSKHAAEARVRAAFDAGLAGAILRPSLVVADACGAGPGDVVDALGAAFAAAAAREDRRLDLPMPASAAVNAVPVDWVVRMMMSVASRAAHRTTYHLTAPSDTTVAAAHVAAQEVYGPLDVRFDAPANRLLDRAMLPFRAYFDAGVRFDRANLELDVPDVNEGVALDLPHVLRTRARPAGPGRRPGRPRPRATAG